VPDLTRRELKRLLHYDPITGHFRWLVRPSRRTYVDDVAGCTKKSGYVYIVYKRKPYLAHRLAFLYMTGHFPKRHVDHVNQNKADNSWGNLRECSRSQNMSNRPGHRGTSSKYRGVSWSAARLKWKVAIQKDGVSYHAGYYVTEPAAAQAYNRLAKKLHGEFAHFN
jgi:hypothetical protein